MDKSAGDFHSLTANVEHIKYTAVVKDSSSESGQVFVRRDQKMRIDFTKPDQADLTRMLWKAVKGRDSEPPRVARRSPLDRDDDDD